MPRPRPMGKASSSLSSFAGPCLPSGLRSKTTSWTSLWSQGCVGPLQSPWMNEKSIPEEIFPFYWRASTLMATTYSTAFYIPWFETKQCNKEIMFRIVGFYFHFFFCCSATPFRNNNWRHIEVDSGKLSREISFSFMRMFFSFLSFYSVYILYRFIFFQKRKFERRKKQRLWLPTPWFPFSFDFSVGLNKWNKSRSFFRCFFKKKWKIFWE